MCRQRGLHSGTFTVRSYSLTTTYLAMARVRIVSPLVGEQETTTSHCRGVIDAWLRDSDPDFAQGTEYSYYPVQPCLKTSEGFYSIGATMVEAMAIMVSDRLNSGKPVDKRLSRQIRLAAKHALLYNRPPRPAYFPEVGLPVRKIRVEEAVDEEEEGDDQGGAQDEVFNLIDHRPNTPRNPKSRHPVAPARRPVFVPPVCMYEMTSPYPYTDTSRADASCSSISSLAHSSIRQMRSHQRAVYLSIIRRIYADVSVNVIY